MKAISIKCGRWWAASRLNGSGGFASSSLRGLRPGKSRMPRTRGRHSTLHPSIKLTSTPRAVQSIFFMVRRSQNTDKYYAFYFQPDNPHHDMHRTDCTKGESAWRKTLHLK